MDQEIKQSIEDDISSNNVHLFMKGTPLFPQCGFSSTVVQILTYLEVPFTTTNVLENENVREGIKEFSNWPTIPQFMLKVNLWVDAILLKRCLKMENFKKFLKMKK